MDTPETPGASPPEPWTTDRIREAFIYDGGEAEYYDPINGAREQRRMAGAIFDAWLAAHDAELAERLTAPPTDDEREALIDSMINVEVSGGMVEFNNDDREDAGYLADAILASDVWRNRRQGPIADEQVDELWSAWSETNAFEDVSLSRVQETAFRAGAQAARSAES